MAAGTRTRATGGSPGGAGSNDAQQPGPGSLFRVPKYSTRRRFVPDTLNTAVAVTPNAGAQVPVAFTKLDQLDIVTGIKLYLSGLVETWTQGAGQTITKSPFFPASRFQSITFKLQAAYNSFNLTGPLAAIIQNYRPMWGSRGPGLIRPNSFANPANAVAPVTAVAYTGADIAIDVPLSFRFDEYYDLTPKGDPARKIYDAIVSPQFMAAQARVVTPTVTLAPALTVSDLLGGPETRLAADATSTYAVGTPGTARLVRDAFWTANNPAANPPQFPWQYTRDYFTQPTAGQSPVTVLIQNTGVSVGQVMSLFGFVWDPAAAAGLGAIVPLGNIATIQLVTGGSLLNQQYDATSIRDRMDSLYPNLRSDFPDGVFVLDFAMSEDGGYLTNEACINTYLVNGVAIVITFKAGSVPSSGSTVFLGVEALKMATS
jgi:hypothetical protein